jgi:hypothetical protein
MVAGAGGEAPGCAGQGSAGHIAYCRGAARMVAVYLVRAASVAAGLKIHWLVVLLRVTVAATAAPVAAFFRLKVAVPTPLTGLLKVAVMLAVRSAPVEFTPGALEVTVGAALVVNRQLVEASGRLARSRMLAVPPVRVAV